MSRRIKKYVAAVALVTSLAGGGSLVALNSSSMIASTANAGQPSCDQPVSDGQWCP